MCADDKGGSETEVEVTHAMLKAGVSEFIEVSDGKWESPDSAVRCILKAVLGERVKFVDCQ
jgi:hypothetical protein